MMRCDAKQNLWIWMKVLTLIAFLVALFFKWTILTVIFGVLVVFDLMGVLKAYLDSRVPKVK